MLRHRRVLLVLLPLVAASLTACGSGDSAPEVSEDPTTTTTTAADTGSADAAYVDVGPNEVGTTSFALDDGRRVVSWYPAAASAAEQPLETFDIASLLSPELQSEIPAEKRPVYEIPAHPGAEPADGGPYPVVLFSHGFAGFPEQSADLVTHLASWGFVVVAPDHVERSLSGLLGTAGEDVPELEDSEVLSQSLDAAVADAEAESSPLNGMLDIEQVAVIGHSAGAGAAYGTASTDDRIDAIIAYSIGLGGGPGDDGEPPPVTEVPAMIMGGTTDGIIPYEATEAVYDGLDAPKYLVSIEGAGHLVFSDICLIGRDAGGLAGLIVEVGLDLPDTFTRLATDGCEEGDLDPAEAFPAIDHLSVAFLRTTFGIDPEPVGLDPAVTDEFTEADVTLEAEPA